MFGLVELILVWSVACIWYAQADQTPFLVLPPGESPGEHSPILFRTLDFSLRHVYHRGAHTYPDLHRYIDIPAGADVLNEQGGKASLQANTVPLEIERLRYRKRSDIDELLRQADLHGQADLPATAWEERTISGPNTTDKATVISLAWMAANAYVPEPWEGDWKDVKGGFNFSEKFGWEMDGLRGHIFVDKTNSTIVIGLKGTSMAIFDGAETTGHDKTNDNLFASCCGGQGGPFEWKQVANCMTSAYTCNSTCIVKSLWKKDHYYHAARDLYHNVSDRYPGAEIWMSGHSLGGVVSSLLGLTYGIPVMTFEAYPDALAASRLRLPVPPGYKAGSHQSRRDLGIYHYGHTADPVYMGLCNGAFSLCTIAGYAMESLCHTGHTCEYNTVEDLGWHVSVNTHRILSVIPDVLEKYDKVPECRPNPDCTDCDKWKFFRSNGSEKTTTLHTSTSTRTRTRTETCKTPGWWGCLDESTTTTHTATSTSTFTTTMTTTICKTPGWFGCLDPVTSTSTQTVITPKPAPSITSATSEPTSTSSHTTCTSKDWFGFICIDPSPTTTAATSTRPHTTSTTSSVSTSTTPPDRPGKCVECYWYGWCKKWDEDGGDEGVSEQRL